jgi:hypothetical protein
MNANEQDLVAADKYFDVEISGSWSGVDANQVTIHNYTTDVTRYINVYTTGAARHAGKSGANNYKINPSGNTRCIGVSSNYVTIDGIECLGYGGAGFSSNGMAVASGADYVTFKNNIIHDEVATNNGIALNVSDGTNTNTGITVENNLIYGHYKGISDVQANGADIYVYNNTVIGGYQGMWSGYGSIVAKNNICSGNSNVDYGKDGSYDATSTNNSSGDATVPALNTYYASQTFSFVDADNDDYHLLSSDAGALGKGVDLSGTFTTDIDGETRVAPWDIGADEYIAPAAPTNYTHFISNAKINNMKVY